MLPKWRFGANAAPWEGRLPPLLPVFDRKLPHARLCAGQPAWQIPALPKTRHNVKM